MKWCGSCWPCVSLEWKLTLPPNVSRFDSDALAEPVEYGLNWGQEMCAPLLVVGGTNVRYWAENEGLVAYLDCACATCRDQGPMPTVLSSLPADWQLGRWTCNPRAKARQTATSPVSTQRAESDSKCPGIPEACSGIESPYFLHAGPLGGRRE